MSGSIQPVSYQPVKTTENELQVILILNFLKCGHTAHKGREREEETAQQLPPQTSSNLQRLPAVSSFSLKVNLNFFPRESILSLKTRSGG